MAFQETISASELVALLQSAISVHGDLPVYLNDPDSGMPLAIVFDPSATRLHEDYPEMGHCMSISGEYT